MRASSSVTACATSRIARSTAPSGASSSSARRASQVCVSPIGERGVPRADGRASALDARRARLRSARCAATARGRARARARRGARRRIDRGGARPVRRRARRASSARVARRCGASSQRAQSSNAPGAPSSRRRGARRCPRGRTSAASPASARRSRRRASSAHAPRSRGVDGEPLAGELAHERVVLDHARASSACSWRAVSASPRPAASSAVTTISRIAERDARVAPRGDPRLALRRRLARVRPRGAAQRRTRRCRPSLTKWPAQNAMRYQPSGTSTWRDEHAAAAAAATNSTTTAIASGHQPTCHIAHAASAASDREHATASSAGDDRARVVAPRAVAAARVEREPMQPHEQRGTEARTRYGLQPERACAGPGARGRRRRCAPAARSRSAGAWRAHSSATSRWYGSRSAATAARTALGGARARAERRRVGLRVGEAELEHAEQLLRLALDLDAARVGREAEHEERIVGDASSSRLADARVEAASCAPRCPRAGAATAP